MKIFSYFLCCEDATFRLAVIREWWKTFGSFVERSTRTDVRKNLRGLCERRVC